MTILSDGTIRRLLDSHEIEIEPYPDDECFQPSSVDLTLSNEFKMKKHFSISRIDESSEFDLPNILDAEKELMKPYETLYKDILYVYSRNFILGRTIERIKLPNYIVGIVDGKSTLGRKGLSVHSTAGYIDPGFDGTITLELSVSGYSNVVKLEEKMRIAQIHFEFLDHHCLRPYGHKNLNSHYQFQQEVTEAYK